MRIKTYYQYLMYVLEHKKNVFKVCWKKKMYKHAFTHDLSKFCKKEFIPYAKYFYIDKDTYKAEFKQAWEHHYKNNPHHWQYWKEFANMQDEQQYNLNFGYIKENYGVDTYKILK